MNDSRTAMAAAVAGGYLLGRTKKAKLAFAVGSYLAGRRVGLSPGQVLGQGLGSLRQAPQFKELSDQVRGELLTAGRAAVTAAANRRLTGLADSLRDRTDALTGEDRGERGDDGRDDYDDDSWDENAPDEEAPDEEAYFDDEDRAEDRRPAPAPPRKSAEKAAKRPPAKKTTAKKSAAKKAAPAKRAAGPGGRRGGGRA
ncbi:hypothetical protein [Streptomyces sp. NPDC020571]|uniref:hypothetical protein n=1 Tax=Streptomyces sp. NPDC020571 TaxID=3365079 RepID=UPI003791A94E